MNRIRNRLNTECKGLGSSASSAVVASKHKEKLR